MSATFATITARMRLNFFARNHDAEHHESGPMQPETVAPPVGKSFPADEVVWGIVIRNGFDELDDPGYHRGVTQHAYLEGNDNVAICGFRPPQSGPRTRRRSRLGLPSTGVHPMCGSCARLVVAPRPRVPVPVQVSRPPVAVPVARPAAVPVQRSLVAPPTQPVAAPAAAPTTPMPTPPVAQSADPATSPWVRDRTGAEQGPDSMTIELGARHDSGLLERGVHTHLED